MNLPGTPVTRAIELEIAPGEVRRMLRHPVLAAMSRPGRGSPVRLEWYGPVNGRPGLTLLCSTPQGWQLEQAGAEDGRAAFPASPSVVVGAAADAAILVDDASSLEKAGGFEGTLRQAQCGAGAITVLNGHLAGQAGPVPACRVRLSGIGYAAVTELAGDLPLRAPRAVLALAALTALGKEPSRPPPGAPLIAAGTVGEAVDSIVAQLVAAVLHWAPLIGAEPDRDGRAVHQARVAVRRLRSALSVFKDATACAEAEALVAALRDAFGRFGSVRDWDVFLAETGPALAATLPDDARIAALLDAARQRQAAARAELKAWLLSPAWRRLGVALAAFAALRPWETGGDDAARIPAGPDSSSGTDRADVLRQDATGFARSHLRHARKKLPKAASALETLPPEALHDLRKRCKRLRYAAEFFAPLFPAKPVRKYLKRLGDVQDVLGRINDAAVAGQLMGKLGRGHEFASGAVQGWAAARAGNSRETLGNCWRRLRKAEPFW